MLTVNDRDKIEWKEHMTVNDVLEAMRYNYALITVTVNEQLVPEDEYETFPVPDDARVQIFHLAHGG